MSDLFMTRRAAFSGENDRYRDELRRCWDASLPMLVVCMLNPSTADHEKEGPTLLILIHFGKLWGFGGLIVVNLYSLRASQPSAMMAAVSPRGKYFEDTICSTRSGTIVALIDTTTLFSWRQARDQGWRVVRVEIREVKR